MYVPSWVVIIVRGDEEVTSIVFEAVVVGVLGAQWLPVT
jgi:hypothetical protein